MFSDRPGTPEPGTPEPGTPENSLRQGKSLRSISPAASMAAAIHCNSHCGIKKAPDQSGAFFYVFFPVFAGAASFLLFRPVVPVHRKALSF
jgi:hypothetical protein